MKEIAFGAGIGAAAVIVVLWATYQVIAYLTVRRMVDNLGQTMKRIEERLWP